MDSHHEVRDSIDIRWFAELERRGYRPILVPNHLDAAYFALDLTTVDLILLTGGATPNSEELSEPRQEVEEMLLTYAWERGVPVLGVCRGAQVVWTALGGKLAPTLGHRNAVHEVACPAGRKLGDIRCYHSMELKNVPDGVGVTSIADDGTVESFVVTSKQTVGVMWHPERQQLTECLAALTWHSWETKLRRDS